MLRINYGGSWSTLVLSLPLLLLVGTTSASISTSTLARRKSSGLFRRHPNNGYNESSARINSNQPANIGFRVYEQNSERALRVDDDDDDDDDDTPRFDPPYFDINFNIADVGYEDNICLSGCEGEYDEIHDALNNLWWDHREEYELFFMVQGRYAIAAGVIYDDFEKRVEALRRDHPDVDTLVLVNCPGSANDYAMVKGARLVHQYGYKTCVPSDGNVESGGTDMFVSGVERYATPGAKVGIHSWAGNYNCKETVGSDFPKDHPEHIMYLDLVEDICIPYDYYWQTLKHGLPMYYITENEMVDTFPYMRDCTSENNAGETCEYTFESDGAESDSSETDSAESGTSDSAESGTSEGGIPKNDGAEGDSSKADGAEGDSSESGGAAGDISESDGAAEDGSEGGSAEGDGPESDCVGSGGSASNLRLGLALLSFGAAAASLS